MTPEYDPANPHHSDHTRPTDEHTTTPPRTDPAACPQKPRPQPLPFHCHSTPQRHPQIARRKPMMKPQHPPQTAPLPSPRHPITPINRPFNPLKPPSSGSHRSRPTCLSSRVLPPEFPPNHPASHPYSSHRGYLADGNADYEEPPTHSLASRADFIRLVSRNPIMRIPHLPRFLPGRRPRPLQRHAGDVVRLNRG